MKKDTENKETPTKEKKTKFTDFKFWLMEQGISQNHLANKTSLSTNTINRLVNEGKASKSVIKLVAFELGLTLEQLNNLLKEHKPIKA